MAQNCTERNSEHYSSLNAGSIVFEESKHEYITKVQMQEINDKFVEIYGNPLFDYVTMDQFVVEYLTKKEGRTIVDLRENPITRDEAFGMIDELSKIKKAFSSESAIKQWFKKKHLTSEKVMGSNPVTKEFYDSYQDEINGAIKRNITDWNAIVDGESTKIPIYDNDGNFLGKSNGVSILDGMGLSRKKRKGSRKVFGGFTLTNKDDKELLEKWSELEYRRYVIGDVSQQELEDYEREISPLVMKSKGLRAAVEAGNFEDHIFSKWEEYGYKSENQFRLTKKSWMSLMNDIFKFDENTYDKWVDGVAFNGEKYSSILKREFMKEVDAYLMSVDDSAFPIPKEQVRVVLLQMFDLKKITKREDYFSHIILDPDRFTITDPFKVINDLKTGRLKPEVLLSMQSGSNFWLERKGEDGHILQNPLVVAETRIISSIQARKNLMLRALSAETMMKLNQQIERVNQINPTDSRRWRFMVSEQSKVINNIERMQEYIRLLATDATGVPRETIAGNILKKMGAVNLASPAEADEHVASISRSYRALKVSTYLGFSIKSAVTNVQQRIGPVAVEFGFKRMLDAQKDMGIGGAASKRASKRVVITPSGQTEQFDVLDEVGLKFDDIMSLVERGMPRIPGDSQSPLIRNTKSKRFLDNIESRMQNIAQFSLEHTILGNLINFVDGEYKNRAVTALAAFDSKFDSLVKNGVKEQEAKKRAIKYARNMVNKLQFDYSVFNRPEFLRGNLGSAVFIFKNFAVNQTQLQWDWIADAKRGVLVNSQGIEIDGKRLAKLARASMFILIDQMIRHAFSKKMALIVLSSPILEYFSDLWEYFFGDKKEKESAFFGRGGYGAIDGLASGPVNDVTNLIMLQDQDMRRRAYQGTFDGFIPGGREWRKWVFDPTATFPGLRQSQRDKLGGRFTYLFGNDERPARIVGEEIILEAVAASKVWNDNKKLKETK